MSCNTLVLHPPILILELLTATRQLKTLEISSTKLRFKIFDPFLLNEVSFYLGYNEGLVISKFILSILNLRLCFFIDAFNGYSLIELKK